MKAWHWIALAATAGAGYLLLRAYRGAGLPAALTGATTAPAHSGGNVVSGVSGINALLGLPDPSTVPLGTTMNVGNTNYTVTQSRQPGSVPQWTFGGFGGGVPGMIT